MKKIIPFLVFLVLADGFAVQAKVSENEYWSIAQIFVYDENDEVVSTGSGVVIDEEGRMLTNYHVISDLQDYPDGYLSVCMTVDVTEPPLCFLVVEIVYTWEDVDLALLQIVEVYDYEAEAYISREEFLDKYDTVINHVYFNKQVLFEESVEIGDEIQILGYPGVGGSAITYTKGTVSGFERVLLDDGTYYPYMIKTDASINPGNSGGGAFNSDSLFIGIPSVGTYDMGDMAYIISLPVINLFLTEALGEEYMEQYDLECAENSYLGDDLYCYCNEGYTPDEDGNCITYDQACKDSFGMYSYNDGTADEDGIPWCYCEEGYGWSDSGDTCVLTDGADGQDVAQILSEDWTAGGFSDVGEDYKYADAVFYVRDLGVVQGYADGTFKPFNEINRAEFVKILIEAKYQEYLQDYMPESCFSDVGATEWYAKYVCFAKGKGIIGGYPDGTFKPSQNINVVEAMKIVLETYFGNVPPSDGEWYKKYVDYALKHGFWLEEWSDNSYLLKRGEMAELMYRALVMINE